MKTLLLVVGLLWANCALHANASNDSLAQHISNLPDDTAKVNALYRLAMDLRMEDSTASANYARDMLSLAEELDFTQGQAKAYYALGRLSSYYNEHEHCAGLLKKGAALYEKAAYPTGTMKCYYWIARCYRRIADYPNYQKYLALLEHQADNLNNKEYLSYAYEGYGNLYRYVGDYPKSIEYYMKAIELSEEIGNMEDAAGALNNMSLVYAYQDKTEEVLEIQLRNYEMRKKLGVKSDMVLCLSNLSSTYSDLGQDEKAWEYIHKAMAIIEEVGAENVLFKDKASTYAQFGYLAADEGDYATAIEYYHKDIAIREENKDVKAVGNGYGNLAYVYELMGDDARAEEFFRKELAIHQNIGYLNGQKDVWWSLTELKSKQGDHQAAYLYLKEYIKLSDSVTNAASAERIAQVEAQYKVKEQQQQITLLSKDKALQELELERRQIISYTLGGGLILVFLCALMGLRGYLQKQRINEVLEEKVNERTAALKEINEELNTFIYKSSHDLRAPLASILGLINVSEMEVKDTEAAKYFALIKDRILTQDKILSELLRVSRIYGVVLKPELLNPGTTIREIIESSEGTEAAANVRFKLKDDHKKKIKTDTLLFMSIVQNIMSNAILYKNTAIKKPHVSVKVKSIDNGVNIIIEDNGIGIEEEVQPHIYNMFYRGHEEAKGSGLGLYITKKAVDKLGGSIKLKSKEGKGSTFTVFLPRLSEN